MAFAPLYNEEVIKKKFSNIELNTKQKVIADEWISKIKNKELEKEVENYDVFKETILVDLLGYPRELIKFEQKDVEFSITDVKGITHVVFEAKGTKTKNLFARQNYGKKEQEHPVIQTVSDMQRFAPPAAYGVCTNYKDFVILDRELGITKCHIFDFLDIEKNPDKLKEFIGIFSYDNLVTSKSLVSLYENSITVEKEFTKEFYKLFHETRLMLIKAFQEKDGVTKNQGIYFTQMFLNRLIFIFFVEDKGYVSDSQLFTNRLYTILESVEFTEHSKKVYDEILELFVAFDKGESNLGIFGFNGGLFSGIIPPQIYFSDLKDSEFFSDVRQNSKLAKSVKLNEKAQRILGKYQGRINPIITNLLLMDSFNFETEVNVNILGHIFEQSIGDLEELKNEGRSKRKKDGIFYTPENITEYICRNTIIPYLSKSGIRTVPELIQEYSDDIEALEAKLRVLKIIDPACGSGAFLVKAIDVLLEIHKDIQDFKESIGKYSTGDQLQLTKWSEESEMRMIVENNIYGVDLNPESVEITRLSIFLKLANNQRKLIGLSKNIQTGNSLIGDTNVDHSSFVWEDRFPEILKQVPGIDDDKLKPGKFDIVLGNPPYERTLYLEKEKEYYSENFASAYGSYDILILFIELGLRLIKDSGTLGFIVSNKFLVSDYGKEIRRIILDNTSIDVIVDLADAKRVFTDALVSPAIIVLKKTKPKSNYSIRRFIATKDTKSFSDDDFDLVPLDKLVSSNGTFNVRYTQSKDSIYEKINSLKKFGDHQMFDVRTGIMGFEYWKMAPSINDGKSSEKDIRIATNSYVDQYCFLWGKTVNIYKKKFHEPYTNYETMPINENTKNLFLKKQKIIVRGVAQRLTAVLDNNGIGFLVAVHSIIPNNDYDPKFILALLNSKFYNWIHKDRFYLGRIPEGSLKYPVSFLKELPIPDVTKSVQQRFIDLVDIMSKKSTEKQDILVKVSKTLLTKYSIPKTSEKLGSFYELDFNMFQKEIEKLSKKKLHLSEIEELEDYFSKNKTELNVIINTLSETQEKIDERVFSLFNINSTEKQLIENELIQ